MTMRDIRQTFLCKFFRSLSAVRTAEKKNHPRSLARPIHVYPKTLIRRKHLSLLLNLSQNLRILEQEIFLQK